MTDQPPWEWVDGDPVRSAQFALITGVFLGAASMLVVYFVLEALAVFQSLAVPVFNPLFGQALLWSVLGPELLFLYLFPRRFPVVGRLGISPVGLRLGFPLRTFSVAWESVERVGPDWVDVAPLLGTMRYRLTRPQSERLRHFLGGSSTGFRG